jgi:hypothetical protein
MPTTMATMPITISTTRNNSDIRLSLGESPMLWGVRYSWGKTSVSC